MTASLRREGLRIAVRNSEELENKFLLQLVAKSRQAHIGRFEGTEDVGTAQQPGRFRNIESYKEWARTKHRLLYLLINPANPIGEEHAPEVGGIAWFGYRQNPLASDRNITFAMRTYDKDEENGWQQYVGRGLAVPFMQTVHLDAGKYFAGERVWLDLVSNNEASRRMCRAAGYQELCNFEDMSNYGIQRTLMVNDSAFEPRSIAGSIVIGQSSVAD